jgi:hypothetical protein
MKRSKRTTASEFLGELANDPDYQTRRAVLDATHAAKVSQTALAARPLVDDLVAAGAPVTYERWDISSTAEDYTYALPILRKHLFLSAPDPIPESVARAMAVPSAIGYRQDFIGLFRDISNSSQGFRDGLAVAIAATTTKANLHETIVLLRDRSLGMARLLLLSPLRRSRNPVVMNVLLELQDDPDFTKELATWKRLTRLKSPPASNEA